MSTPNRHVDLFLCGACLLFRILAQPGWKPRLKMKRVLTGDRVTLPDGTTIELAGVSEYSSHPDRWWRSYGSPLSKPPVDAVLKFQPRFEYPLVRVFVFNIVTNSKPDIDGPSGPDDSFQYLAFSTSAKKAASGPPLLQRQLLAATALGASICA